MSDGFPGVTLCDDVEPANWLRGALRPWTDRGIRHVATLVPADYRAHARIFHRAWSTSGAAVRWADIAERSGRQLTAETCFVDLVGWRPDAAHQSPPPPWMPPDSGSLTPDECAAVAEVLAHHTATPDDSWFCMWEGYGTAWTVLNRLAERAPRVALEHRRCLLFRGPVRAATAFRSEPFFQSPTLWWPADRAWCVASELDIYSTYVSATADAVRALVDHPQLETVACSAEQDIDHSPYPT